MAKRHQHTVGISSKAWDSLKVKAKREGVEGKAWLSNFLEKISEEDFFFISSGFKVTPLK